MKTRIAGFLIKAVAVTGLTAGLVCGGGLGSAARQADADNYFIQHPGPVGGRTDVDPFDPYAPVDLGGAEDTTGGAGNARAAGPSAAGEETAGEWSSSPRRPGQPF